MTTRQFAVTALTLGLVTLSSHSLNADVRTDEKTRMELGGALGRFVNMFAGKAAKEGVTTTIAVKGNRGARMSEETGQIIDLTEEKVYELDLKKKSYKVTTFAELRRQMEEAQKKAQEQAAKMKASEKPSEVQKEPQKEPQVEVDFNLKNTGEKKTLNGYDTREQVMTITVREKGKTLEEGGGLVLTADQWIAPPIPAMKEVGEFYAKFMQKVYGTAMLNGMRQDQMATMMAMYPMMKQAIGKMTTEGQRIQGTPILTTTTFEAVKSAAEVAQEAQAGGGSGGDDSKKAPASVGGLLGGIARRAAAKKASGGDQQQGDKSRGTIMTSTTEVLKVATDVSASDVAIPAGFKESK